MSRFRILELAKKQGITQKDLAAKIGMTPAGLAKAANGNPTVDTLEKIATALGVEISDLFVPASKNVVICPKCGTVLEVRIKE